MVLPSLSLQAHVAAEVSKAGWREWNRAGNRNDWGPTLASVLGTSRKRWKLGNWGGGGQAVFQRSWASAWRCKT